MNKHKKLLSIIMLFLFLFSAIVYFKPTTSSITNSTNALTLNQVSSKTNDPTFYNARFKRRANCTSQKLINLFSKNEENKLYDVLIPIGIAVYQNIPIAENLDALKNNPETIENLLNITSLSISTTDRFLFYVMFESDYGYNTKNIISKNESVITVSLELYLETTEAITFLIYEDIDGHYAYQFIENKSINFNNSVNQITLDNIPTNRLNPINTITINFDDNLSTTKK